LSLLGLTLSFVWIASLKLVVANGFISYRTLFTGTRSFAVSEIERSDLAIGYETFWDRFKPPIRLVIQPQQSTGKKPISLNLKVFSKPDVLWVLKVLGHQTERWSGGIMVKQIVRLILSLALIAVAYCSHVAAQDTATAPQFHSRSEHLEQRRKVETAFPDVIRALRTLHLPPGKMNQAEAKLQRSELETRAARAELQSLSQKQQGQDYERRSANSARVAELRAGLQKSTEQLDSDIKALLTPPQRNQYDKLRRASRGRSTRSTSSHP
jgi:hypothetical protein